MSTYASGVHLDFARIPVASHINSEQVEEVCRQCIDPGAYFTSNVQIQRLSSEVTTAEILQCGHIISHNLKALEIGLEQTVELICGVVRDILEANTICPILQNAIQILAKTIKHADAFISTIDEALLMFYRCINNQGHWHKLPAHLRELQEHNRCFHELWPQSRESLTREILPALSGHFYSSQSIFPAAALWLARITRSEQFFPRLQAWGQLPRYISGLCAALDPLPPLLDTVETYTTDLAQHLQIILSNSPHLCDAESRKIKAELKQVCDSWASYFRTSRLHVGHIEKLDPSRYLPFSLRFS